MSYTTYIIQDLTTKRFYMGYTNNLNRRLNEHNRGKTRSLRNRGPFKVVYSEIYLMKHDAYRREKEIKSFKGGAQFKKLLTSMPS